MRAAGSQRARAAQIVLRLISKEMKEDVIFEMREIFMASHHLLAGCDNMSHDMLLLTSPNIRHKAVAFRERLAIISIASRLITELFDTQASLAHTGKRKTARHRSAVLCISDGVITDHT